MRGVLGFLTGQHKLATFLRQHFVFKIVPMLNPDGVVLGNYRSSMAGLDLNRQWRLPDKNVTPCIYYFKKLFRSFRGKVVFFCDIHGHSTKTDAFMYGCENKDHVKESLIRSPNLNPKPEPKSKPNPEP